MREIFFDEKLGETRRNSEGWERWERLEGLGETRRDWERWEGLGEVGGMGCEPHGQGWELWEGWERWGGSGENSPRLTYSAIADNPEGGLAGKGM